MVSYERRALLCSATFVLICIGVCLQVNYGQDFEQQLNFFMEARAVFCNLDTVLVHLVHVSTVQIK